MQTNRPDRSSKMLVVELNEFNPEFLSRTAKKLKLSNLARILELRHSETTTDDAIEHQGLDPWVQWVGIHLGKPTREHGIRRLGATHQQTDPQIWTAVARDGYSWGVWGAMNAPLGDPRGCKFFMPDPWSFDEVAYPSRLNDLLALPRYAATNYLDVDRSKALVGVLKLARFFAPPSHWPLLLRFAGRTAHSISKTGPNVHSFATLLDYLSVLYFVRLRKLHAPDFSLIFLNHIAHLQHQFWFADEDTLHPEMELGLRLNDAMFGLLLGSLRQGEAFLVMNGLRQKNVANQGHFVYRQINPQAAAEAIGIVNGKVLQCMTHDAHIVFDNSQDADRAEQLLRQCRLSDNTVPFYVERESPTAVFYQLEFEHDVPTEVNLICGNYTCPFYDIFQKYAERTGAHIPDGDVFTNDLKLPARIHNHEIYRHILMHFSTPAVSVAA